MTDDKTFEGRLKEGDGTLRLSEWESLTIADDNNLKPLQNAISPETGDRYQELSVGYYFGNRIKANHFVGAMGFDPPIECSKGLFRQVIITPKICGKPGNDNKYKWADFIRMLEVAYEIKLPELRKDSQLNSVYDLRIILALIYAQSVEMLLKKHLRRNYVIKVDRLNGRVKGKLLLTPYIRESIARGQPQIAVCQYYELTPDTPLNRIIKAGLRSAKRLVASADCSGWDHLSGRLNKLLGLMGNVRDVRITRVDCARVRLHAQNRYYESPFKLAQMLLFRNRFEHSSGDTNISGFFLDMNDLFEKFILGLLKRQGYDVDYQKIMKFTVDSTTKNMKPGYYINSGGKSIIGDAKYKALFSDTKQEEKSEKLIDKLSIYHSDIYQLVAYLDNAKSKCGVLFYPTMGNAGSSKLVEGFGDKEIRIVGVDLSDVGKLETNGIPFGNHK